MAAKRKHSIEGVLFDWDGTLINSYDADTSAYLAMFKRWASLGDRGVREHYSPNWYQVYRAAGCRGGAGEMRTECGGRTMQSNRPKLIPGARRVLADWATLILLAWSPAVIAIVSLVNCASFD